MEAGLDYQVLTNIFEIQILTRFGISLNFNECVFAIGWVRPLTFSLNMEPAFAKSIIMKMRDVVISIPISHICSINFKPLTLRPWRPFRLRPKSKQDLRKFMDQLYEEYVGIHLKSKKFIDSLADWGQLLKEEDKWKNCSRCYGGRLCTTSHRWGCQPSPCWLFQILRFNSMETKAKSSNI